MYASKTGVGAVQLHEIDSNHKPVEYFSKHLNKTQQRYSTSERELSAVELAIKHFKFYFLGKHFTMYSDHQPLKWIFTTPEPAAR